MSVWQLVDLRPCPEALKDLAAAMEAAGWTRISDNLEVVGKFDLVKGARQMSIEADGAEAGRYLIHCSQRLSDAEMEVIFPPAP